MKNKVKNIAIIIIFFPESRLNVLNHLNVIVATAVLHNLLKCRDVPPPEVDMEELQEPEQQVTNETSDNARRNTIVLNYFNN